MDTRPELDTDQRRVVEHTGGPLLVLGSPGTGKSRVLVERWLRLAAEGEPHRILLLVAKRERALHLRDELPWLLDSPAVIETPVHTWHALAYHLVTRYHRKLDYEQAPVLLNTNEQWTVVSDLLATEDAKEWDSYGAQLTTRAFINEVADFCVRTGHRGLDNDDLERLEDDPAHQAVARFALRYRRALHESGWLDYGELIGAATRLLEDPGLRERIHGRFVHVLADDLHEVSPAQLALMSQLNTEHLICAGDPDSSIEAFRGADPGWIERLEATVGQCMRIALETSHRFGPQIGDVARAIISRDPDPGHRWTKSEGRAGSAEVACYATMAAEIESAARQIRSAHILEGTPYDRMAILLAQPSTYTHPLKRVLDSLEVPYRIGADRPLQLEPSVRAVLDLCRLALTPPDDENTRINLAKAVLASPLVGARPQEIRELERSAYKRETSILDEATRLGPLLENVRSTQDKPAGDTFAHVLADSPWSKGQQPDSHHQHRALKAQADALAHFEERRPRATMRDYLSTSSPFAVDTWEHTSDQGGLAVLSFHAAKGQEWDLVCILGVAEGLIPKAHRSQGLFDPWSLESGTERERALAQLAEERRTFFVALTRARNKLVVSCSPGTRRATPSRFIAEAFGSIPDTTPTTGDSPPLTLSEAGARHRRTLTNPQATVPQKEAAAAALAHIPNLDTSSWWWTRGFTEGQPLTPSGKLVTSYSRIGTYDNCPLQYLLQSVLGLDPASTYQMKFGSLVHNIIERSDPVLGDIKTYEEAHSIYTQAFQSGHKNDYPNIAFARTYYTAGVKMIKLWWNTERSRDETVAVEYKFDDLNFDGHIIRGRIDRVARNQKGVVLTDYKTSKTAASYEEAAVSLQLAIYYRAAQVYEDLRRHGDPVSMQLVYPGIEDRDRDTGEAYCRRRTQKPKQAEDAIANLHTYLNDAAMEHFDPSPEADCRWCKMKVLCPRWPEGMEVPS